MVHHQEPKLNDGLTDDELVSIYRDGERAATRGLSMLDCRYLEDPKRLPVWMRGYLKQPIEKPDQLHS